MRWRLEQIFRLLAFGVCAATLTACASAQFYPTDGSVQRPAESVTDLAPSVVGRGRLSRECQLNPYLRSNRGSEEYYPVSLACGLGGRTYGFLGRASERLLDLDSEIETARIGSDGLLPLPGDRFALMRSRAGVTEYARSQALFEVEILEVGARKAYSAAIFEFSAADLGLNAPNARAFLSGYAVSPDGATLVAGVKVLANEQQESASQHLVTIDLATGRIGRHLRVEMTLFRECLGRPQCEIAGVYHAQGRWLFGVSIHGQTSPSASRPEAFLVAEFRSDAQPHVVPLSATTVAARGEAVRSRPVVLGGHLILVMEQWAFERQPPERMISLNLDSGEWTIGPLTDTTRGLVVLDGRYLLAWSAENYLQSIDPTTLSPIGRVSIPQVIDPGVALIFSTYADESTILVVDGNRRFVKFRMGRE